MGLTGVVLSFTRTERNGARVSDVKSDPGGGALLTSEHFQPAGVDASPLPGDYTLLGEIQGTGRFSAAGYVDPKNLQTSQPGEWRAYSRDAAGEQVAQVWTKNDGTVLVENGGGFIKLLPSGAVDINGFIIGTNGAAESPVSITAPSVIADSKELAGHDHPAGTPPGTTGPNN